MLCIHKTASFLANYAPHSLQVGRKMEPYGSKRVSFSDSGRNQTQAMDPGLSQSEAFPPLSPDCSDVAREHDIMLPIKGERMQTLEALRSDLWHWALGLSCGDRCSVADRKAGLSFRDIVSVSIGKHAFMPFLLLSLLRHHSPCAATASQLRQS